ncbi:MAG: retropepsin-like domain-containing protein [Alistipes sp.]|nr:retropepsin-like domain-containing protein [Alistipes sp.]
MRYLLTILFAFAFSLQLLAQQPTAVDANARVGALINSADYVTLGEELPALRAKVAKPLLALADALVAYSEGRFEDSNKAIDVVSEFAPELGSEVVFGMQNLSIINYLSAENYKAGAEVVQMLLVLLPEDEAADNRRHLESLDRWFAALATKSPVEMVRPEKDVVIPVEVRGVGNGEHLVIDAKVGDNVEKFIFDTGCGNSNFISTAAAERLGVEIVAEHILVRGFAEGYAKLGFLPEMQIGDITIRNATFCVVDKIVPENAEVEGLCEAVLGTHIIRKMGEIRFEREKSCFVLPAEESVAPKQRNIFFDSHYYIWCNDGDDRVVMHFDTGNNKTYLSSKYYNRFTERVEQEGSDVERSRSGGFGGVEWCDIRTLPKVEFDVCGQALQVEKVAVTMPTKYEDGTPYIEPYDGVVGVDFLTAREVVTFDLSRMFFRVDK